jgi:hypothetical protein
MRGRILPRRRGALIVALVLLVAALLVVPSLVAAHYSLQRSTPELLLRPDLGWRFLFDAITQSRGARVGDGEAAMAEAREVWAGPPAIAREVDLVWTEGGAFTVPPGASRPVSGRTRAVTRSPLAWLVRGPVRGGPDQVIGVIDYRSGRVAWDVRPVAAG